MKKRITVFTAFVIVAVLMTLTVMTSCGNSQTATESDSQSETEDTSVFDYDESDLSAFYTLASLDLLSKSAIRAYIEKTIADSAVENDGDKATLNDGYTLEAGYVLYGADGTTELESGEFSYTLGEDEPFAGLYDAIVSSVVTIGANRTIRTLAVPEKYDEESVILTFTAKRVTSPYATEDDYEQPLSYYRNALLLEYNGSLTAAERVVEDGDTVTTSYKLVSRASNGGYAVGDVIDSGDSFRFTVGDGSTVAGFDSAFLGHVEGDSFSNEMTLPEDYGTEYMHGLDVTFECTVKKVSKPLNEKSAKAMGYDGLDDFNARTEAHALESYTVSSAAYGILRQASDLISLPASALYTYKDETTYYRYYYLCYLAYYYSMYGVQNTVEDIVKAMYGYESVEKFLSDYFTSEELDTQAKRSVEDNLFLFSLVKAAGLDITDEEFRNEHAEKAAVMLGYADADEYCKIIGAYYDVDEDRAMMLMKANYYRIVADEYLYELYK